MAESAKRILNQAIGDIAFEDIHFDAASVGYIFQKFASEGSKRYRVTKADLHIINRTANNVAPYLTIKDAIAGGTRLFDAMAYFAMNAADRPTVVHVALQTGEIDPDINEIARSFFFVYFYLISRGRAPAFNQADATGMPPAFLTRVLSITGTESEIVKKVASFDINKMDNRWIKYIDNTLLGTEAINRLALGNAGYRLASALSQPTRQINIAPAAINAQASIVKLLEKGALWDVHPVTRTPEFLSLVKNFNKNLENVMMYYFTQQDLEDMKNNKKIFKMQLMIQISWNGAIGMITLGIDSMMSCLDLINVLR